MGLPLLGWYVVYSKLHSSSMTADFTVVEPESMPMCTAPLHWANGLRGTAAFAWRAANASYSSFDANSGGSNAYVAVALYAPSASITPGSACARSA